MTLMRYTN